MKLYRFSMLCIEQASSWRFFGLAFIVLLTLSLPYMTGAEEESKVVDALTSPEQMTKSLDSALASQRAELADLKILQRQLETLQDAVQTEIKAYDSQDAAHGQLLLMSKLRIEDLENAIKDNRLASRTLAERVDSLQKRLDSTSILFQKATDRIELAQNQIADIRQSQLSDAQKLQLDAATQELLQVLKEEKQLGERNLKAYGDLLGQVKPALEAKKTIGEKMTAQLASLKKASLFERVDPLRDLSGKAFREERQFFWGRITAFFSSTTWKTLWERIKMGGVGPWSVFLTALVVLIALPGRYGIILKRIEERCEGPQWYYRRLGLFLLRRSLPYLGMTLLFGFYSSTQFSLLNIDLVRFLFFIFLVLLITRWGLDYLNHGFRGPPTDLRSFVSLHLKRFLRFSRAASIVNLMLLWIMGRDSLLTWMARAFMSAGFLAWAVFFWRQMKLVVLEGVRNGQSAPDPKRISLVRGWTYLFFGGALLLVLAGYGNLSAHWFRAWALSVVLLFWGWISLNAVQEWHHDFRAELAAADAENPLTSSNHWRWSLIQLARVGCFFGLATGMIWVWDPSGFIWSRVGYFFGFTITIGSLNLSIKGIVLAIAIIFITHLAVRVGRELLKERVLDKQSLESGLKDSILTITSYLGWGLGLILALGTLGVNATSLAVIFGALSIGIGFGLQNIFNNFISGLILLFERPIQVGDYIEVGGLWAEVKKINVRATVVQTFDNASVIIPNSELISQQVTNWSFKDKRMRRNLDVGVAYGSDIDLVQKTLLDIAQNTRGVLKYPRPDVLFIDHADSALIFRLRIWVNVDDFWAVPSQIRCDIDRRFRELAIEIAFPQRDLHIRTLPGQAAPIASPADLNSVSPKFEG
ncbi:MAG: mechanosensitive ion channel domain-containing protein [Desulfobacterales bacterium]